MKVRDQRKSFVRRLLLPCFDGVHGWIPTQRNDEKELGVPTSMNKLCGIVENAGYYKQVEAPQIYRSSSSLWVGVVGASLFWFEMHFFAHAA